MSIATWQTYEEAVAEAKLNARNTRRPYCAWRYMDADSEYVCYPEGSPIVGRPMRPVAVYDPDGSEHC